MISWRLRPMQPSCPSQLTIHGLNYQQNEKKNYIFQWLCLVPTPVPIQEQRLPAILAPKRVRLPEPKRNAKGEQRAIRISSSKQEEEEPWTQNHRSRQHNSRHRRRSKMNSGRGKAETYPIARRDFLAGEASWRLLLRRFGSPLLVLAIDSSCLLGLPFLLFILRRGGGVLVCMGCWICLARASTGRLDTWD